MSDEVEMIWCAHCGAEYPSTEPMIMLDFQEYCSYNCVAEFIECAIDDDTKTHEGYVEATTSFNKFVAELVNKTLDKAREERENGG